MIEKHTLTLPERLSDKPRRLYVYLPDSYVKETSRRYPVLYMFDGQNVFFDEDAAFGKSWGMGDYLCRTQKELIVVAVECYPDGTGRLREYSPMNFEDGTLGKIRGKGKTFMEYLVKTLKPDIDRRYRTIPDRDHTILAGSSMGGLMALYGVAAYNRVFRRAACLSPSLWVNPGGILELVARAGMGSDTCVYMDYGSEEMGNHAANAQALLSMAQLLLAKRVNLTLRVVPGGTHCEASWEKQIPIFMDCLGL